MNKGISIVITLAVALALSGVAAAADSPRLSDRSPEGPPQHLVRLEVDPISSIIRVLPNFSRDVINSSFTMVGATCDGCGLACPPLGRTIDVVLEATAAVPAGFGVSNLATTNYTATNVQYSTQEALTAGEQVTVTITGDVLLCGPTFKLYFSMCDVEPALPTDSCTTLDTTPVEFNYSGSAESYTVPPGATSLLIVANGASGGDTETWFGGYGTTVDTQVAVTAGQTITIVVGEQPAFQPEGLDGCGASGGGGTFVALAATPLAVAGGGGGAIGFSVYSIDGNDASVTEDGVDSGTLLGGTGGNGGAALSHEGGGGGGFLTDGADSNGHGLGGDSFLNGAAGGARASSESCGTIAGGFGGGGGGGNDLAGAGGGYSGGAACDDMPGLRAGGGGSYDAGSGTITVRMTHGHGSVTITPQP